MSARIVHFFLVVALVALGSAGTVSAQTVDTRGVVQSVDPANGIGYFTDGRIVRLRPGAHLFVGNREVLLSEVQPGWTLVVPAPVAASSSTGGATGGPVIL